MLIYDYIDIHIPMCEVMYRRRLKGYAAVGYSIRTNELFLSEVTVSSDIIYDGKTFVKPFIESISGAKHSIILSCPKIKVSQVPSIIYRMRNLVVNGISVIIVTKEENDDAAILRDYGIRISVRSDINFDCCIIDKSRIWYGSVNILGFHSTEDNVITFQDAETANNLIDVLLK